MRQFARVRRGARLRARRAAPVLLRGGRFVSGDGENGGNCRGGTGARDGHCGADGVDLTVVDGIVARHGKEQAAVIPILQALQEHFGYLPESALRHVCATTRITPATITGVASFYDVFELQPSGRHRVHVCHGTACHVKGAERITEALEQHLGLEPGQHSTADGEFTLGKVACIGCCTLAPAVRIGDTATYAHLTPDTVPAMLDEYRAELARRATPAPAAAAAGSGDGVAEIRISLDSCCVAAGTDGVHRALAEELRANRARARLQRVGCVSMCHQVPMPMVEVREPGRDPVVYAKVTADEARAIVGRHFPPAGLFGRVRAAVSRGIDRLLTDQAKGSIERHALDVRDPPVLDFLGRQRPIATEHSAELDPLDVDAYLARGGFAALRRCRELRG
ncbi:MAG: NADH-quinone oxidoreductase subunit NuoE, partial [Planctomycetes bacterium]|nr:NADH-quinone oxidoreductase subunit NuoE [Planctomycetota bacterium]